MLFASPEGFSMLNHSQPLKQIGQSVRVRVNIEKVSANVFRIPREQRKFCFYFEMKEMADLKKFQAALKDKIGEPIAQNETTIKILEEANRTYLPLSKNRLEKRIKEVLSNQKPHVRLNIELARPNTRAVAVLPKLLFQSSFLQVVSFYKFVELPDPHAIAPRLRAFLSKFEVLGRIYLAREGINAQFCVPSDLMDLLQKQFLVEFPVFGFVEFNPSDDLVPVKVLEEASSGPFGTLDIRVRKQVLSDGLSPEEQLDPNKIKTNLVSSEVWQRELTKSENKPLVLDCRNFYESRVGTFKGSIPLKTSNFKETWYQVSEVLKKFPEAGKSQPIFTYCTGGIRCVKVGAYLEQRLGLHNVFGLKGGIIAYNRFVKEHNVPMEDNLFLGKNFVFDNRMEETITEESVGTCDLCGLNSGAYTNCSNLRCHSMLFICSSCSSKTSSCCCMDCKNSKVVVNEQIDADLTGFYSYSSSFILSRYPNRLEEMTQLFQAQTLKSIVGNKKPRNIFEIGTFSGLSTFALASGYSRFNKLTSCDHDSNAVEFAKSLLQYTPFASKLNFLAQDWRTVLQQCKRSKYDVFFIDGDKTQYSEILKALLDSKLTKPASLLIFDVSLHKLQSNGSMWPRKVYEHLLDFKDEAKTNPRVSHLSEGFLNGCFVLQVV